MKILFICGSLNQTTIMHKVACQLSEHECFYTPYYADGFIAFIAKIGLLNNTILGGRHLRDTLKYIKDNSLPLDYRGISHKYDLVVTGSDAIIQKNIKKKRILLIQEGMTEPEGIMFHLVKTLGLPRWLANTSVTGTSNEFDAFCVMSNGYRELFIKKGVQAEKIVVTGIPNFDDFASIQSGYFPYKNYVLVATTPFRETMRPEFRPQFLRHCLDIANGRQLIFKLHPLENAHRAIREINHHVPGAKVFWRGNINPMIYNADTVITQQSTCTFVAMALGKEVFSNLKSSELKKLMPIQNNGTSANKIASLCRVLMNTPFPVIEQHRKNSNLGKAFDHVDI